MKRGGKKIIKTKNKIISTKEWLPIQCIYDNGIIKLKDDSYIKIIKIIPINYNLKSELEKEAILNSYKIFLKTCNFNLQILIQSNKEDLSKHISCVNNSLTKENNNLKKIGNDYINYLNKLNINKKSSIKNFYIILKKEKNIIKDNIENINNIENIIFDELNDNFIKVKDTLSRCGNLIIDINDKNICKKIIFSFFYPQKVK